MQSVAQPEEGGGGRNSTRSLLLLAHYSDSQALQFLGQHSMKIKKYMLLRVQVGTTRANLGLGGDHSRTKRSHPRPERGPSKIKCLNND